MDKGDWRPPCVGVGQRGVNLHELLLHHGDGVPCVGAHAGCSRPWRDSSRLFPLCCSGPLPTQSGDRRNYAPI